MGNRIYVTRQLRNPEFASPARSAGLEQLATLATVEDQPAGLSAAEATGVIAVIADSAPFRDSFYAAAAELRLVARWGVGSIRSTSRRPRAMACSSPLRRCTWTAWRSTPSRSGSPP